MATTLREWALAYANKLQWKVFPLAPRGKRPLIEGGLLKATTDEEQINEWWSRYPNANIGHALDPDILVIDIDGEEGERSVKHLELSLPEECPAQRTGNGRQLWCAHSGARNRAAVHPGVDFRGEGGYVVLPPSIHPNGRRYEWERAPSPGDYADLESSPSWVRGATVQRPRGQGDCDSERARIDGSRILEGVDEGSRDDTIFRYACSLRHKDLSYGEARELVVTAASNCSPPFPEDEAIRKLEQAWKYPAGKDPATWDLSTQAVRGPELVKVQDLIAEPRVPIDWLIDGVLPPGLAIVCGNPKGGKSFLAGNAAIAISKGGKFLGGFSCTDGESLYLDLEQTRRKAADRWRMMSDGASLPGTLYTQFDWPMWKDGLSAIDREIKNNPSLRLVVIDVMETFIEGKAAGEGNVYRAEYSQMKQFRDLVHKYDDRGLCLMLVHHTNKTGMFREKNDNPLASISGSTAISGACDTVWVLDRNTGSTKGTLFITGKEVQEWTLDLKWHPAHGVWSLKDPLLFQTKIPGL